MSFAWISVLLTFPCCERKRKWAAHSTYEYILDLFSLYSRFPQFFPLLILFLCASWLSPNVHNVPPCMKYLHTYMKEILTFFKRTWRYFFYGGYFFYFRASWLSSLVCHSWKSALSRRIFPRSDFLRFFILHCYMWLSNRFNFYLLVKVARMSKGIQKQKQKL
jgi:hypothetical protein